MIGLIGGFRLKASLLDDLFLSDEGARHELKAVGTC